MNLRPSPGQLPPASQPLSASQPGNRRPTLIIMARRPVAGAVKTRLARDLGTAEALRFYRTNLRLTLRRLSPRPHYRSLLALTPDPVSPLPPALARLPVIPQGPGTLEGPDTLGERMARLCHAVPGGPVILIGTDIPAIRPGQIRAGFAALQQSDIVLGPSCDGGYWLVGLRQAKPAITRRLFAPEVFHALPPAAPSLLERTLQAARPCSVTLLDTMQDIDHASDLASDPSIGGKIGRLVI